MERQGRWFTLTGDCTISARLSAISEPAFVLIAGTLLTGLVLPRLGVGSAGHYLFDLPAPDFRTAAYVQFVNLVVRYGFVLGLAALIGMLRGRRAPASYGLGRGSRTLASLVGVGVLMGLVASLPIQGLRLLLADLQGAGTRFWALEARTPWSADFWLYMAVGSYFAVPVFEELYTRGYLLGRVRESFSAGGALILMAAFFALAHAQYRSSLSLGVGAGLSLFLWAAILGYSVYRTGWLLPAFIAHVIANVPMNVEVRWALMAASLLVLVIWIRPVANWSAGMARMMAEVDDWFATLLALAFVVAFLFSVGSRAWAVYAWLCIFGLATVPGLFRQSAWANRS